MLSVCVKGKLCYTKYCFTCLALPTLYANYLPERITREPKSICVGGARGESYFVFSLCNQFCKLGKVLLRRAICTNCGSICTCERFEGHDNDPCCQVGDEHRLPVVVKEHSGARQAAIGFKGSVKYGYTNNVHAPNLMHTRSKGELSFQSRWSDAPAARGDGIHGIDVGLGQCELGPVPVMKTSVAKWGNKSNTIVAILFHT